MCFKERTLVGLEKRMKQLIFIILLTLFLASCGQSGPLFLPVCATNPAEPHPCPA